MSWLVSVICGECKLTNYALRNLLLMFHARITQSNSIMHSVGQQTYVWKGQQPELIKMQRVPHLFTHIITAAWERTVAFGHLSL
jgi:hypothetical protein